MRIAIAIAVGVVLVACSKGDERLRDGRDVARVISPDGTTEAGVREVDVSGSVMVSQWYQVFVRGVRPNEEEPAIMMTADKTDGIFIRWLANDRLEICFSTAQIFNYRNTHMTASQSASTTKTVDAVLVQKPNAAACK